MSMAKDSTTMQEYFISGIVILFFGLLYLFLSDDFQFGTSKDNLLPTLAVHQTAIPTSTSLSDKLVDNSASSEVLTNNVIAPTKKLTPLTDVQTTEGQGAISQSVTSIKVDTPSVSVSNSSEEPEKDNDIALPTINDQVETKFAQKDKESEQPLVQGRDGLQAQATPNTTRITTEGAVIPKENKEEATVATQGTPLDPEGVIFKLPNGNEVAIAKDGFEHNFKQAITEGIVGKPIIFDRVYFDSGLSALKQQSNKQISATAALLNTYKDINIAIRGHSDNKGSSQKNSLLSLLRSRSMKKALTELGIAANRIQIEGVGDQEPIATNKTKRGRRSNRRIDLVIKKQIKGI
jgi:outer membrane protein OmpA-like peptidoglycan-associated protein